MGGRTPCKIGEAKMRERMFANALAFVLVYGLLVIMLWVMYLTGDAIII